MWTQVLVRFCVMECRPILLNLQKLRTHIKCCLLVNPPLHLKPWRKSIGQPVWWTKHTFTAGTIEMRALKISFVVSFLI